MRRARRSRVAGAVLLLLAAAALPGCVERVLVIESTPPGARVLLDGKDRGTTPVRVPYVHEGVFRVRLEMEGHEAVVDEIRTPIRADAVPGIDFFAENVWPGRVRRVNVRRYELPALKASSYTPEELEALLKRAEGFRERTRREVGEPGSPVPSRPSPPPPPPSVPSPKPPPPAPPPPAPQAPAGR